MQVMTLPASTRDEIYDHLCSWVDHSKGSGMTKTSGSKPFHEALLPRTISLASGFERTFSTGLGSTFEAVGQLVARDNYQVAERQYRVEGFVPTDSLGEIARIVENLDRRIRTTDYREDVQRLVKLAGRDNSSRESRGVMSDLYVRDKDGNETYFEIKTPYPNKGQCLKIMSDHLLIHCMRREPFPRVRTYYGMAYNPFGEDNPYKYNIALTYLDVRYHTLIGREFWDYLGGSGAYEDVLAIYRKVGHDKAQVIRDKAGLDSTLPQDT